MAEFLPNLDDGELWLPSDIFLNVDVAASPHLRRSSLDHRRGRPSNANATFSPKHCQFEGFMQPAQFTTAMASHGGVTMFEPDRRNSIPLAASPELLCRCRCCCDDRHLLKQALVRQASLLAPRGNGVVRVSPDRVKKQSTMPCTRKGVSPRRECAGTGVFFPRVAEYSAATDNTRKRGQQNGLGMQIAQKMNSIARGGEVSRQEREYLSQLPPEMILPRDWTY